MGSCGGNHLFCSSLSTLEKKRLDRPDSLPAIDISVIGAGKPAGEEINGPAIEINAINQVILTLGGFTEMFA
jgi:hypothetical protein